MGIHLKVAMQFSIHYINADEITNHFTFAKGRNLLCNHNNGDLNMCEVNMLFSHVKMF